MQRKARTLHIGSFHALFSRVACLALPAQQLPISAAPELWEGELLTRIAAPPARSSIIQGTHVAYWIISHTLFSRVAWLA